MSKRKCVACGKDPAEGFASVYRDGEEQWYCHPDEGDSCYVGGSSEPTMGELAEWLRLNPGPQQVAGFAVKYVGSFPYVDKLSSRAQRIGWSDERPGTDQ